MVTPLTFASFSRAFKDCRPAILYDVLHFLLGANKEDFYDSIPSSQLTASPRHKRAVVKT